MGRGLSNRQRSMLGLAVDVMSFHGRDLDRGTDEKWPRIIARVGVGVHDLVNPLCVHLLEGIPVVANIWINKPGVGGYYAGCPGNFDNKEPGVKVAKVGIAKAITRLLNRGLLYYASSDGRWIDGYTLTLDGYEIGKEHCGMFTPEEICEGIIRIANWPHVAERFGIRTGDYWEFHRQRRDLIEKRSSPAEATPARE